MSPVNSHFWGGFWLYWAQQQGWLLVWKAKPYQLWAHRDCQKSLVSIPPASSSPAVLLTITTTSLIETKVRERERKLVSWNSGTLYGGEGEEAADDRKCEEGKALGRQQISWKMGKRATVAWTGIYEPVLCPAQEAQFSEHWERIIFHLHYSCSFVYSTRWENLHPNSRNAQTHEYYLYLIKDSSYKLN